MPTFKDAISLLVVAAFAVSCSRDTRENDAKVCIAESQGQEKHGAPNALVQQNESLEEQHDRVGGLVVACMERRGYRHDEGAMTDDRCVDDVDFNPYCYVRRN